MLLLYISCYMLQRNSITNSKLVANIFVGEKINIYTFVLKLHSYNHVPIKVIKVKKQKQTLILLLCETLGPRISSTNVVGGV